jgi:hypothetical protein
MVIYYSDQYSINRFNAGVAQLVEHYLAKVNVTGSNPVTRSKIQYVVTVKLGELGERLKPPSC